MKVVVQEGGSVGIHNTTSNVVNGRPYSITVSGPVSISVPAEEGFTETTGPSTCGSFYLNGLSNSYVNFTANSGMDFGLGPFTIEWFQFQTDNNPYPRVFARGSYGGSTLGVSIEGGAFYFWDSGANGFGTVYNYKNTWVHFAITRDLNNNLRLFMNGSIVGTITGYTHDFSTSSDPLMIGVEGNPSDASSFGGYITNFHIMKGAARYTRAFSRPTSPLKMTDKSILMMYAPNSNDQLQDATNTTSGFGSNVSWSSGSPFA